MNREEAIDLLDNLIGMVEDNHESDYDTALQMGIKALEHDDAKYHEEHGEVVVDKAVWEDAKKALEPCEDAISRQAVMDALCDDCELFKNGEQTCFSKCEEYHFLATLPPVTPQPKTGHWIAQDIHNCHTEFRCSACGYTHSFMHLYGKPTADYTYCPKCGARMVEEQESEDKE